MKAVLKFTLGIVFSGIFQEEQWWITGFNPCYTEPNPKVMVSVGMVDFAGHEEMFAALQSAMNDPENKKVKEYIIFDEDDHTVWINWYNGSVKS